MSAEVTPIRAGVIAPDQVVALRDALVESAGKFADRYGRPPIGATWVLFDAEGNTMTGWVIPAHSPTRQTLAFSGARLTEEALKP